MSITAFGLHTRHDCLAGRHLCRVTSEADVEMSELDDLREIQKNVGDDVLGTTFTERIKKLNRDRLQKIIDETFPTKNDSRKAGSKDTGLNPTK